jgi:hypothetical protein
LAYQDFPAEAIDHGPPVMAAPDMEVTMPFVIHPRVRKGLGRLAAMTAAGVLASTGVAAAAACPHSSTTAPFSQFGDHSRYFVVPGGNFEGSSLGAGWSASGASLTPGNEPFHVLDASDHQSLTIQPGGSVTTAFGCIDAAMPEFRFFAHQAAAGSQLNVDVIVKMPVGTLDVPLASLADGSMANWGPTAKIFAPRGMVMAPGTIVQGALKFSVAGNSGSWQIDDILVDPYRSA